MIIITWPTPGCNNATYDFSVFQIKLSVLNVPIWPGKGIVSFYVIHSHMSNRASSQARGNEFRRVQSLPFMWAMK